tara:strand:+ start:1101 stop:1550 length:450 start_codon:yes stop_codon:yes gene_type:complete
MKQKQAHRNFGEKVLNVFTMDMSPLGKKVSDLLVDFLKDFLPDAGQRETYTDIDLNGDGKPDEILFVRKPGNAISKVYVRLSTPEGDYEEREITGLKTWGMPSLREVKDYSGTGSLDIVLSPFAGWEKDKYVVGLNDGKGNFNTSRRTR